MSAAEDYFMATGHPPSAKRVVAVDFDGTLYPLVGLRERPALLPGAIKALRQLKANGYFIYIHTSRLSPTWLREAGESELDQIEYIESLLARDGVPHDRIGAEKVPAAYYLDDNAVRVRDNWSEIVEFIEMRDAALVPA